MAEAEDLLDEDGDADASRAMDLWNEIKQNPFAQSLLGPNSRAQYFQEDFDAGQKIADYFEGLHRGDVDYMPTFDAISNGELEKKWERNLLSGERLAKRSHRLLVIAYRAEEMGESRLADRMEQTAQQLPMRRLRRIPILSDGELDSLCLMVRTAQSLPRGATDPLVQSVSEILSSVPDPLRTWASRWIAFFAEKKGVDESILPAFVSGFGEKLQWIQNWLAADTSINIEEWDFGNAKKAAQRWLAESKERPQFEPGILAVVEEHGTGNRKRDTRIATALQGAWEKADRPEVSSFLDDLRLQIMLVGDWLRETNSPPWKRESWNGLLDSAQEWSEELQSSGKGHPRLYINGPRTDDWGSPVAAGNNTMWVVEMYPEDLPNEGNLMGHCVGREYEVEGEEGETRSYAEDVEDGVMRIFSLRDRHNLPHATWNLYKKTDWGRRSKDVQRWRDSRRNKIEAEILTEDHDGFIQRRGLPTEEDLQNALRLSLERQHVRVMGPIGLLMNWNPLSWTIYAEEDLPPRVR
jgi:hypothetical protein